MKLYYPSQNPKSIEIFTLMKYLRKEYQSELLHKKSFKKLETADSDKFEDHFVLETFSAESAEKFIDFIDILKFLGKDSQLYPTGKKHQEQVDKILFSINDLYDKMEGPKLIHDEKKIEELKKKLLVKHIPDWLGFITSELVNNTKQYTDSDDEDEKPHFIVGNKPTIADFAVGAVFNQFFLNK